MRSDGEYIKYNGNEIKIGTDGNLYYTSYKKYDRALKAGLLSAVPGQAEPQYYARCSTGILFRFPFPDEDRLPFGTIGHFPFDRGIPIKMDPQGDSRWVEQTKLLAGKEGILEIAQQKLIHQDSDGPGSGKFILALIIRNPESQNYFRIADTYCIDRLNENIMQNHIMKETDPQKKKFYRQLSARILNGYKQNIKVPQVMYKLNKRAASHIRSSRRI